MKHTKSHPGKKVSEFLGDDFAPGVVILVLALYGSLKFTVIWV
jgi:hypothetical protein